MASIDDRRHRTIFNADAFNSASGACTVIGAGAVGSKIALELAKLGVRRLTVIDDDVVAAHNIPNQVYDLGHVGVPKVKALEEVVMRATGMAIRPKLKRYHEGILKGHVFVAVDSMAGRAQIWRQAQSLTNRRLLSWLCEVRMGADQGRIYTLPAGAHENGLGSRYEQTLYSDDEVEAQTPEDAEVCDTNISVGATAATVAAFAVWQFMRAVGGEATELETLLSLNPPAIYTSSSP